MPSRDYPAPSQEKTTPESVETKRENIQDRLFRMLDELNAEFTANGLEKDKETLTEIKKEISRLPKEFKDKHGQLNEIVKEFENREATFDEVYNGYRPSTPQIRSQIFNKYRYDKGQQKYLTDSRQVLVSLRTSDPNNSVYIGRLKNLGSYGNSEVGLKTALQTRAIEPANHGLSPQAEKIFLAKFGLIPNTGDEEWYRELFRKGETQPEDKVLGWYSGNHKTSVP
ncbi:MAG: hypothetical protein M1383_02665, partial [Patescibacteria group bacterium]|nr:hypothetical protein [Patescibacteria group bacterium]